MKFESYFCGSDAYRCSWLGRKHVVASLCALHKCTQEMRVFMFENIFSGNGVDSLHVLFRYVFVRMTSDFSGLIFCGSDNISIIESPPGISALYIVSETFIPTLRFPSNAYRPCILRGHRLSSGNRSLWHRF